LKFYILNFNFNNFKVQIQYKEKGLKGEGEGEEVRKRGEVEKEGRDNTKMVSIPRSKVVREFNGKYMKCKNIIYLYLREFSKNLKNLKINVDFYGRAKLELR